MTTTLSSKGQVVILLAIRKRLGLSAGAIISIELQDGRIVLECNQNAPARCVSKDNYVALVAPAGAPQMTSERVKDILAEL